ncbi:hypothetical protein BN2127_JRS10_05082 [Bacillus subtilis]|nr:hypothetical protein BN2127_JRS10_05082 [Bacillus subtilis]
MERTISIIKQGDYVQFSHREDSSLKITGYVVNILTNTIVVDISETILSEKYKDVDTRQVVKHGQYKKVRVRKNKAS